MRAHFPVSFVSQFGIIQRLCDLLELPDPNLTLAVLAALDALLRAGNAGAGAPNPHARMVDEAGGALD